MTTNSKIQKYRAGFTLIELSIVLVVVGLIMGSVYASQEIIDSSRRSAVIADLGKYTQAYHDFLDKYHLPPGDYNYRILNSSAAEYCVTDIADGSGQISYQEGICAWRALAQAGFIEGSYGGDGTSGGADITQSPKAPYDNTYYNFIYFEYNNLDWSQRYANVNVLTLGLEGGTGMADYAFLTPTDAMAIDFKIDDGLPVQGKFFGRVGADSNLTLGGDCASFVGSSFALTAEYNTSRNFVSCYIVYLMDESKYIGP